MVPYLWGSIVEAKDSPATIINLKKICEHNKAQKYCLYKISLLIIYNLTYILCHNILYKFTKAAVLPCLRVSGSICHDIGSLFPMENEVHKFLQVFLFAI